MSNKVSVDPARALQRLLTSDPVGALYAQLAMKDVALEDAYGRIAQLEADLAAAAPPAAEDQAEDTDPTGEQKNEAVKDQQPDAAGAKPAGRTPSKAKANPTP